MPAQLPTGRLSAGKVRDPNMCSVGWLGRTYVRLVGWGEHAFVRSALRNGENPSLSAGVLRITSSCGK